MPRKRRYGQVWRDKNKDAGDTLYMFVGTYDPDWDRPYQEWFHMVRLTNTLEYDPEVPEEVCWQWHRWEFVE